jgi:hypothetical protein
VKYQIVLESKVTIADDEFERFAKKLLAGDKVALGKMSKFFTLKFARNLEGIRPEVYMPAGKQTAKPAVAPKRQQKEKDPLED